METLKWNKHELPNEDWIKEYLYFNYKYFNRALEYLKGASRPSWCEDLNNYFNVIVIYAFNNSHILYIQATEMDKYCPHCGKVVYVDDSTDSQSSNEIRSLASLYDAYYWKVPRFTFFEDEDVDIYYHNQAINLSYYYLFKGLKFDQLIMLDHDIIPVSEYYFPLLDPKQLWHGKRGLNDYADGKIYPWPGFSIFNRRILDKLQFNFFQDWIPYKDNKFEELDTGGAMAPYMEKYPIRVCQCEKYQYKDDYFEMIDNCWLHLRDTSDWSGKGINKMEIFKEVYQNGIEYVKHKYKLIK